MKNFHIDYFRSKAPLAVFSGVLSLFTLIAYHIPFFIFVLNNVEGGFNKVLIFSSLILLMLGLNYFFYYLILYLFRMVGKILLSILFIANSVAFYFITSYDTLITAKMMGNVFNTRYSEASGFFSVTLWIEIICLGVVPCVYLFWRKIDYGRWRQFFANIGISLGVCVALALINIANWPWIDRNAPTMGSIIMPWSYTINTIRWWNSERDRNREEIRLPDAEISKEGKDVCILIIGESARSKNFSLYGYPRPTNPLLTKDSVINLKAKASATYTTSGVKAILEYIDSDKLYEILPNYLYRSGVEVSWRTSNWGEPPVHIEKYLTVEDLEKSYPDADKRFDGILFEGLAEEINNSEKDKILIILHTSTSHGPTYYQKYPAEFERFKPVCTTVEMSKADPGELINAYDNTILYTDYLVHNVIQTMKGLSDRRSLVMFVSDHGESLGEKNLYMHGLPLSIAPKEQIDIPFIVWTSDKELTVDPEKEVSQHHVFHTILNFLGISSPIYNAEMDLFSSR